MTGGEGGGAEVGGVRGAVSTCGTTARLARRQYHRCARRAHSGSNGAARAERRCAPHISSSSQSARAHAPLAPLPSPVSLQRSRVRHRRAGRSVTAVKSRRNDVRTRAKFTSRGAGQESNAQSQFEIFASRRCTVRRQRCSARTFRSSSSARCSRSVPSGLTRVT